MPLTSVIMVSYHTGPVLFRAIGQVFASTAATELCLVDNGNPPEVVGQLQAMAAAEPRLTFITGQGNVGFSRACNLGARAARGDFLLFLNPDSLLPPAAVGQLLSHVETLERDAFAGVQPTGSNVLFEKKIQTSSDPAPGHPAQRSPIMIGARLLDEDGRDQRGCRRALLTPETALIEALHLGRFFPKSRLNFNADAVPDALTPMPAISGAFMFLPRDDFWHVGGFDEGYFLHVEDLDLCLRFRRAGGEIYFAPDVVVTHIGATSNTTTAFFEKHKARGFIRYFRQNFADTCPSPVLLALTAAAWLRAWIKIAVSASGGKHHT